MEDELIIIRNENDVDVLIDDALYVHSKNSTKTTIEFKEFLKDMLKQYKQYAFLKDSGNIVACIDDNGDLQVVLP